MKLLQRFRKQTSSQDMEAQAAQELQAAMAAKPNDVPAMAPAPGLPGDDMNGAAGAGETPGAADSAVQGDNGEALGSVTDLPKRRPATARKTGARKPASGTRTAASKAGASTAKPAAGGKTPGRKPPAKPTAKKATPASAGGAVKKRASASGTSGRPSASRQPASKKR